MTEDSSDNPGEEYGFDLRNVSWGYRPIFARKLRELLTQGDIGRGREQVTKAFFDMLKRSRPGSFDFALKEFLAALNPQTKWLLELPGVFEDFCTLGRELAEEKLAHGIAFFRHWGRGGFGAKPDQLQALMDHVRALRAVDPELAQGFMSGYGQLLELLEASQISLFVSHLRQIHRRNPRTAIDFAALRLTSAAAFVRNLTQEARLDDVRSRLERLGRALSGKPMEVADLSGLDSDALIDRGCTVACFQGRLYLPSRIRCCRSRRRNEALYLLSAVVSAEAVRAGSFAAIHGDPGKADLTEWPGEAAHGAVVALIEIVRVIEGVRARMPGARRLIEFGIEREFDLRPPRTPADRLLRDLLTGGGGAGGLAGGIRSAARTAEDCLDSARRAAALADDFSRACRQTGGAADAAPRALIFFPDFYYPAAISPAPARALVAALSKRPKAARPPRADAGDLAAGDRQPTEQADAGAVPAAFVYPEWNQSENDYYRDWCFLREHRPRPDPHFRRLDDQAQDEAVRRARRMFERLRPELARKEKFLAHGDEINVDLLVEFMALRRRIPGARVRFYQKAMIKKRDLAVALLLDVSGSTAGLPAAARGGDADGDRIIDLQKRAAVTLGAGLEALGDAFGIYGFSGNGREHCDFFIYKDMDEPFSDDVRRRLLAANPVASTRIGVAVRHAAEKLAAAPARKKLVILITDGKPQDAGYDPTTRYAQYDVRMACQECLRRDIHVVCISTLENARADLEIMFPHRRYVILADMTRLEEVLPSLYLKMTV